MAAGFWVRVLRAREVAALSSVRQPRKRFICSLGQTSHMPTRVEGEGKQVPEPGEDNRVLEVCVELGRVLRPFLENTVCYSIRLVMDDGFLPF